MSKLTSYKSINDCWYFGLTHHFSGKVFSQFSLTRLEEYYHFLNKHQTHHQLRDLAKEDSPRRNSENVWIKNKHKSHLQGIVMIWTWVHFRKLCATEALWFISTYYWYEHTIITYLCACICTQIYTPSLPSQTIILMAFSSNTIHSLICYWKDQ